MFLRSRRKLTKLFHFASYRGARKMRDFFFSPFLATFPNNREFRASYVKFVPFLRFVCSQFCGFYAKKFAQSSAPHDRCLGPPLYLQ